MKKLLEEVAPEVKKIVDEYNGDVIILVTSNIYGAGKSTLALMLARALWPSFTYTKHMTYTLVEFLKILKNKRVKVQVQDEGKRLGKRTDFMLQKTRQLEDILSETRKFNKVVIVCVGEMARLFKWLANDRAVLWLHIPRRGKVFVFQARSYIMEGNKFGINDKTFKNVQSHSDLYRRLMRLPSFRFVDSFPQYLPGLLDEGEFQEYEGRAEGETLDFIDEVIKDMETKAQGNKRVDYEKIYNEVFLNKDDFLKTWGGRTYIDTKKIEAHYNISYTASRKIKAKVEGMLKI